MHRFEQRFVASRLRELRLEKKLTQQALARLCGVSTKTVKRWEAGERLPDVHVFATLMTVFQCNFRYLLGLIPHRQFIRADTMDTEVWEIWGRLDKSGREALKAMARVLDLRHVREKA